MERFEAELGVKIAECVDLMVGIKRLWQEDKQLRARLRRMSNTSHHAGPPHHSPAEYRIPEYLLSNITPTVGRRAFRLRPVTPTLRPYQCLGHLFYYAPMLTGTLFETILHAMRATAGLHATPF